MTLNEFQAAKTEGPRYGVTWPHAFVRSGPCIAWFGDREHALTYGREHALAVWDLHKDHYGRIL